MKIKVEVEILIPKVPNFVQTTEGRWLPLCALNEDDLNAVANGWLNALRARVREQSKDRAFFEKNAAKGEP